MSLLWYDPSNILVNTNNYWQHIFDIVVCLFMSLFYLFPTRKNISPIKLWYMKPNTILSTLIYIDYYIYKVYIHRLPIRLLKILKSNIKLIKFHWFDIKQHQKSEDKKKNTINDNLWFRGKTTNYVWMVFPIIFQIKHHIKKKKTVNKKPAIICDH